jgi:hypothetical protein
MTDTPLSPLNGLDPVRGADAADKRASASRSEGGAAFRALLDELACLRVLVLEDADHAPPPLSLAPPA